MRRLLLLCALLLTVGLAVTACNSRGTVEPFPESVEGDLEAPEIVIGDATAGAGTFISAGCGGCHAIDGLDGATGAVGPNLTTSLEGRDAAYIQQGIVTPDAVIAEGFTAGLMPANTLSDTEVADVLALLLESSGGA
jgi:mono/diheme cytochrome c family protein